MPWREFSLLKKLFIVFFSFSSNFYLNFLLSKAPDKITSLTPYHRSEVDQTIGSWIKKLSVTAQHALHKGMAFPTPINVGGIGNLVTNITHIPKVMAMTYTMLGRCYLPYTCALCNAFGRA